METSEQALFIQCLSDFIQGRKTTLLKVSVDFSVLYEIAKRHEVTGIVGYQLKNQLCDSFVAAQFQKSSAAEVYAWHNLRYNYNILKKQFDEMGITYIPIKGLTIAELYPIREYRTMGDIDLLVPHSDFDTITKVFQKNGFEFAKETPHEISFHKGQFYYEIHEFLINGKIEDKRADFFNAYNLYLDGKNWTGRSTFCS